MPQMNSDELSSSGSWGEKGLWDQIRGYLQPAEVDEVRRAIGEAIIERNEDLHREVEALAAIVDEFREQTYSFSEERRRKAQLRRDASLGLSLGTERKLLEDQIKMILRQDQPRGGGRPTASSQSDSKVLDYITSSSSSCEGGGGGGWTGSRSLSLNIRQMEGSLGGSQPPSARPMSALSSARSSGRPSARSLPTSMLLGEALGEKNGASGGGGGGEVKDGEGCSGAGKLSASNIQGVVAGLRAAFAEEQVRLQEDVEGLMATFEGEDDHRQRVEAECKSEEESVPSTRELRDFSQKLQRETAANKAPPRLAMTTNQKFGFASSTASRPLGAAAAGADAPRRSLPSLTPLSSGGGGVVQRSTAVPSLGSTSSRNPEKGDFLRRPPLPVPPLGRASGSESSSSSADTEAPSSTTRSLIERLKNDVAADAAITARDEYHLSGEDDERFWN